PVCAAAPLRVAWAFRANGGYRHPPFLPIPSRKYVRWRMHTAYGDYEVVPPVEDVVRYARWAGRGGGAGRIRSNSASRARRTGLVSISWASPRPARRRPLVVSSSGGAVGTPEGCSIYIR